MFVIVLVMLSLGDMIMCWLVDSIDVERQVCLLLG